jgi:hypothetical protein
MIVLATIPELMAISEQIEAHQETINDIDHQIRNIDGQLSEPTCKDVSYLRLRRADLSSKRDKATNAQNMLNTTFGEVFSSMIMGGALSGLCKALP